MIKFSVICIRMCECTRSAMDICVPINLRFCLSWFVGNDGIASHPDSFGIRSKVALSFLDTGVYVYVIELECIDIHTCGYIYYGCMPSLITTEP